MMLIQGINLNSITTDSINLRKTAEFQCLCMFTSSVYLLLSVCKFTFFNTFEKVINGLDSLESMTAMVRH